jgi:hypothetical protein
MPLTLFLEELLKGVPISDTPYLSTLALTHRSDGGSINAAYPLR